MSTAQLRTTGGDHLVETGFVTRKLVSVRMDTRRNIRRGNQNQQQEPTTRTTLIEPLSLSTAPVGTEGGDQRVWRFVLVSDGESTLGDNGGVQQAGWSSQDRGGQTD